MHLSTRYYGRDILPLQLRNHHLINYFNNYLDNKTKTAFILKKIQCNILNLILLRLQISNLYKHHLQSYKVV